MVNYYQILGVAEDASDEEIKAAFKKKAVQFHPDKHQGDESMEDLFKEINNAYQTLANPYKRARYDMTLKYGYFEPVTPPPQQETRYQRPFRPPVVKRMAFNSRRNILATVYAFLFAFTVALLVKGGIWTYEYLEAEELKRILAERREVFHHAQAEYMEGRVAQSLELLNDLGRFMRSELDMRDYKDQLIEHILSSGDEHLENKNYKEALKDYKILEGYPVSTSLAYLLNVAEATKGAGDYQQTIEIYNKLYGIGYRTTSFYFQFGLLYEEGIKDYERALRYYQIAAKRASKEYESTIGKAYPVIINAGMIPPVHYQIYMKLANGYYLNQQYQKGIESTLWTKEMWPDSAYHYVVSAQCHLALEEHSEACEDFRIAARLDPDSIIPALCD